MSSEANHENRFSSIFQISSSQFSSQKHSAKMEKWRNKKKIETKEFLLEIKSSQKVFQHSTSVFMLFGTEFSPLFVALYSLFIDSTLNFLPSSFHSLTSSVLFFHLLPVEVVEWVEFRFWCLRDEISLIVGRSFITSSCEIFYWFIQFRPSPSSTSTRANFLRFLRQGEYDNK